MGLKLGGYEISECTGLGQKDHREPPPPRFLSRAGPSPSIQTTAQNRDPPSFGFHPDLPASCSSSPGPLHCLLNLTQSSVMGPESHSRDRKARNGLASGT